MADFELSRALRWLKPTRRRTPLRRRSEAKLLLADDAPVVGGPLLLDTTVYVDVLQGVTPPEVDRLIAVRTCNHSAICLGELTHLFGRLDPGHPGTASVLAEVRGVIEDIRPHRVISPAADVLGSAGILAGLLARLGTDVAGFNDAVVYLQARRYGCSVLTRNLRDFDLLSQLVPDGRVIFYRRVGDRSRQGEPPPKR